MLTVKQTGFLQEKIVGIKTAVLHCPDDEFFNMQAVMARVLKLDKDGFLWLSVDKPIDCADTTGDSFDVVLNYHKEGASFDLDILGEAKLQSSATINQLPAGILKEYKKGKLILQVDILDLDYVEQKAPVLKTIAQKIRYMLHHQDQPAGNKQQIYRDQHQMSA